MWRVWGTRPTDEGMVAMALMPCPQPELHAAHRWLYDDRYDNYCAGQHAPGEGTWFVRQLRRGGSTKRPHFYLTGQKQSICGYGHRGKGDLEYDPATLLTLLPDPATGEPQVRTPCGHCVKAVRPA